MPSLFKTFNIKIPENFEDYNLIGIDFGDGEISASVVQFNNVNNRMTVKSLALNPNGILLKNPNAFYIRENHQQIIYDVSDNSFNEQDGGTRYYNFKKCPGDPSSYAKFVKDDGTVGSLTYREVMVASFNCLVNLLFQSNDESISREKPSIILVGRPSSLGWQRCEKEYAKMLQQGLKLPKGQQPVYVAVQSESTAALARELNNEQINQNEVVVVLDNGSSTFDITVINPSSGGVVGEASYQFGGNQLDENLLTLFYKAIEAKYPGAEPVTKHGHKLGLRQRKESYYGLEGTATSPQIYQVVLNNEQNTLFDCNVDQGFMQKALGKTEVSIFHFERGINGEPERTSPVKCNSWLDGCKAVYSSFYQEMQLLFHTQGDFKHPKVPDRIILSGGVSIMPEVQHAVEEVFGVTPSMTDRPNYSVSTGLGYILGTEVRKRQLLNALIQRMNEELPGADTVLAAIGDAGEDEEWNAFKNAMEEWAGIQGNSSYECSYEYVVNRWQNHYFNNNLNMSIQRGAERWYKDQSIEERLTNMLRESFNQLFPEYSQQFNADLSNISFSGLGELKVTIIFNGPIFTGDRTITESRSAPRNQQTRQQYYQQFLANEQLIRKGGSKSFTYTEEVPRRWPFTGTRLVTKVQNIEYPGIRSMYINDNAATLAVAESTRKDILKRLEAPLEDFVESITPYFNMTARQTMDAN